MIIKFDHSIVLTVSVIEISHPDCTGSVRLNVARPGAEFETPNKPAFWRNNT